MNLAPGRLSGVSETMSAARCFIRGKIESMYQRDVPRVSSGKERLEAGGWRLEAGE